MSVPKQRFRAVRSSPSVGQLEAVVSHRVKVVGDVSKNCMRIVRVVMLTRRNFLISFNSGQPRRRVLPSECVLVVFCK